MSSRLVVRSLVSLSVVAALTACASGPEEAVRATCDEFAAGNWEAAQEASYDIEDEQVREDIDGVDSVAAMFSGYDKIKQAVEEEDWVAGRTESFDAVWDVCERELVAEFPDSDLATYDLRMEEFRAGASAEWQMMRE